MTKQIVLCIFIILASFKVFSQEDIRISGSYTNSSFEDFVEDAESKYDVRFFYKKEWVSDITISKSLNNVSLKEFLEEILHPVSLYVYIDDERNVILSDKKIEPNLVERAVTETNTVSEEKQTEEEKSVDTKDYEDPSLEYKIINIGNKNGKYKSGKVTLSGYIKNRDNGEAVIGAVVYIDELKAGAATDQYGYYTLQIPRGEYQIVIRSIGWRETKRQIRIHSDGKLDIKLKEDLISLDEVVISAKRDENLARPTVGLEKISAKTLKLLPTSMGEVDILKSTLSLPGVTSVGEGAAGINVRGGSSDQNLILLYDVPFFNSTHLFGFFSAYNSDIVEDVSLYKGGIPSKYGGRVSSVMSVVSKDGKKDKYSGSAGISPITAQVLIEGPIQKEKSSFMLAGRSTYSNWLLKMMDDPALRNAEAQFYDVNAHFVFDLNDKNTIEVSGYYGYDDFSFSLDTAYEYKSAIASLKWKNKTTSNLNTNIALGYSHYDYTMTSDRFESNSYEIDHSVNYYEFKSDFEYSRFLNHKILFGLNAVYYDINPGNREPLSDLSVVTAKSISNENGIEPSIYLEDEIKIGENFFINAGIRLSSFFLTNKEVVYTYQPGVEKEVNSIIDTSYYSAFENVESYWGPEYRVSLNYMITNTSSIKLNYNRTRQYIHLLSNTVAPSPTSLWKLSDQYIKPQIGDQYALGLYKNFKNSLYQTQVEVYYKTLQNMIDYKGNVKVEMNDRMEADLVFGSGYAYGVEVMAKKTKGRFNGLINYTYSRIFMKTDSEIEGEVINDGEYYPASYDQPHNLNIFINYEFNRRFSFSSNFTYSTGRPITYPVSTYKFDNQTFVEYSERNQYRIPDYVRMDVAINMNSNLKRKRWYHSSWSLSVYNLLGRSNAYSVYFKNVDGNVRGYKMSIFAQPIPTITYKIKF